jgi:transposase
LARVATRLVTILLSQRGWPASAVADLLGCDPVTVRRWIHRYNTHGVAALADRPRPGRPRLGSPKLTTRIRQLLTEPKACVRFWSEVGVLVPVVFLMLTVVVVLFTLYPGLFTLSQLAR